MNYYNPYFFNIPNTNVSFLSKIFGNLKFSSILSGTKKTLNFVNQTIPVIKQISPMVKNVKTMFNVINQFKKIDDNDIKNNNINKQGKNTTKNQNTDIKNSLNKKINQPVFFV